MGTDAGTGSWANGDSCSRGELLSSIIVDAVVDALTISRLPVSPALTAMRERVRADPRAKVSRRRFLDELERACASQDDPAIALRLGESLNEASFHFAGTVVAGQSNLRESTEMRVRLARDVLGGPPWQVASYGDDVVVGYPFDPELGPGARREAELIVTTLQRSLSHWLGAGGRLAVTAQFGFAAPPYLERYRSLFGANVRFREPLTGVRYPKELLEKLRPGASEDLARSLREIGERWLPREQESWTVRVRNELASIDNLSAMTFDDLAWRWGLSARSLRRRLASEHASFTTLLEEARITRAKALLARNELSLTQIAERLGYWEVNSFQRAFKRWVGDTPGSYRHQAARDRAGALDSVTRA